MTEAQKLVRALLGENIRFELDAAASCGPVRAHPEQLTQVVLNLAVNARDAMPRRRTADGRAPRT